MMELLQQVSNEKMEIYPTMMDVQMLVKLKQAIHVQPELEHLLRHVVKFVEMDW